MMNELKLCKSASIVHSNKIIESFPHLCEAVKCQLGFHQKRPRYEKGRQQPFLYKRKKDEDDKCHRLLRAWQANER